MLNRDPASWPPFPGPDAPEADRLRWAVERFLPPDRRTAPAPASPEPPPSPAPAPVPDPDPERASRALGGPGTRLYAFPWPDALPDLGPRRVQAFALCTDCGAGSWVAYGDRVCCLACARQRAAEAAP